MAGRRWVPPPNNPWWLWGGLPFWAASRATRSGPREVHSALSNRQQSSNEPVTQVYICGDRQLSNPLGVLAGSSMEVLTQCGGGGEEGQFHALDY